jgi:major vault protein
MCCVRKPFSTFFQGAFIVQPPQAETKEIALPPGVFAHLQDNTKGVVRTYVGSTLVNQSGQEQPVYYNHKQRLFAECGLADSIRPMPIAEEGDYLVLENPTAGAIDNDKAHPNCDEAKQDCPTLLMGSKVNVPGPCQFALWPGQNATVIPGHNLRSNQFLVARVYNEKSATENWKQATIRKVEAATAPVENQEPTPEGGTPLAPMVPQPPKPSKKAEDVTFVAGQRIIIRGDEVSFFIPPTGMEVVADENSNYVREAVTLERLEYCILVDEDGNKRYERGPKVVFPKPTENFFEVDGKRKFRAYELNKIQGLHIKVIAAYEEGGKKFKVGEELFITGAVQPIYFPRPEHSIVKYGDRDKHYAVAIPPGEGRYQMNRLTGEFKTIPGSAMLLCDPLHQVIVKRVLTEKQTLLWYPGNEQALTYNQDLARTATSNSTSAMGYVAQPASDKLCAFSDAHTDITRTMSASVVQDTPRRQEVAAAPAMADEVSRGTTYTPPRTLTIDSKFEGVPQICPWTGYAVRIVDKSGRRRTVEGPNAILLNFDEELEVLTLSTGKPKSADVLKRTVYLRVRNNKISDVVENVYTSDHVPLDLKLSFTVDFEGDANKWFDIENYVKFLTDHVRSVLKGRIRKLGIKEFWANGVDDIRNFVLGEAPESGNRPGMVFKQNGMRITDVEILEMEIKNHNIGEMLRNAEEEVVATNIRMEQAERELDTLKREEEIECERRGAQHKTTELKSRLEQQLIDLSLETSLATQSAKGDVAEAREAVDVIEERIADMEVAAEVKREQIGHTEAERVAQVACDLRLAELSAETTARREQFAVLQDGFTEALLTLSNNDTMAKLVEAGSVQSMLGGGNMVEVLHNCLANKEGVTPEAFRRVKDALMVAMSNAGHPEQDDM